jgi:CubicO group peptidase (beta-lactamase class C family)
MRTLFTALLVIGASVCYGQSMIKMADSIRRTRGIPAIGYVVFSSDKIIDMGVSGFRQYRKRDSVLLTDRFHIGTNTFAFTSWIAAKLVEMGKIKWTTTYAQLYPQYKTKLNASFKDVALKDLLNNTAGLASYNKPDDFAFVPVFAGDIMSQRKEFAYWVLQRPGLEVDRKTRMVPSVVGYGIAAAMLEKAAGMPWEKMLEDFINKPMGISAKTGWPNKISPQQPAGHWARYGNLAAESPDSWLKSHTGVIPGFDINISIGDYAKFLQQNLKCLRGENGLLTSKAVELIHFGLPDYSFGWHNAVVGKDRISYHTGESHIFVSHVELIPEKNIGVLVVGNNGESMGKGGVLNLCRLLREYYLK